MTEEKTEDVLLSVTKNCETLIKQTDTKPRKMLEFKLTQSKETSSFEQPIPIEGCWMIGLPGFEVYNSIFIVTEA